MSRYYSTRYKRKFSGFFKLRKKYPDLPLEFIVDVKRSVADGKRRERLRIRHGEVLRWDLAKVFLGIRIQVPCYTPIGHSLDSCQLFDNIEDMIAQGCPEDRASELKDQLKDLT